MCLYERLREGDNQVTKAVLFIHITDILYCLLFRVGTCRVPTVLGLTFVSVGLVGA